MAKRIINIRIPGLGKKKVRVGKLIRKTPGGRHAYYDSNVGIIRKPLAKK